MYILAIGNKKKNIFGKTIEKRNDSIMVVVQVGTQ